jgi:hypothetical protein
MYDITKTRMLLMTAVFAAVAAVFSGGANAAIGTAMATQAVATAPAFPSGDELDTAISTAMATRAARESGTLSGKLQNTSDVVSRYLDNDRMGTGQFSVGYRGRP